MTDEKTRQLENRIDTLESKIEKMMPSRRDALKMGGAALVGGAAMSGTASAGTNQRGTIGDKDATPPQLVDLHSEDINNADTITTDTLNAQGVDAVSVNTDGLTRNSKSVDRHYTDLETINNIGEQPSISFNGIPSHPSYRIDIDLLLPDTASELAIRFNGDDGSTSPYFYWDESGTKFGPVTEIELIDYTNPFARIGGRIIIDNPEPIGVDNQIAIASPNQVAGFAQKGGRTPLETLTDIELFVTSGNITAGVDVTLQGEVR